MKNRVGFATQSSSYAIKNLAKQKCQDLTPFTILFFFLIISTPGWSIEVLERTGVSTLYTTYVAGKEFVNLKDISTLFHLPLNYEPSQGKVVIEEGKNKLTLILGNSRIIINAEHHALEASPCMVRGAVIVPLGFLSKFIPYFLPRVKWDPREKVLDLRALIGIKGIVIDPGHGGKDPGAIGRRGLKEKDVVLDVALRLKEIIEKRLPATRVYLTREEDVFVPLSERANFANSIQAELFISIHANAAFSSKIEGCETYFVSPALDPEARAVEALENSVLNLERDKEGREDASLKMLLADLLYHEFVREGNKLACSIQESLPAKLELENRGVKQALFYVLKGVAAPAILVEIAFISNYGEEEKLSEVSFRQEVAEAIFEGINLYIQKKRSGEG